MIPVPCHLCTKFMSRWPVWPSLLHGWLLDCARSARISAKGDGQSGSRDGDSGAARQRAADVSVVRFAFSRIARMPTVNSFGTRTALAVGSKSYQIYSLPDLQKAGFPDTARLPYSMKILLENLLRHEDGRFVKAADIEALARWDVKSTAQKEISFAPARVLLQDFTGVPAVVDLAAMRDGIVRLGGDPARVNPLQPVELVIDHSVQVDYFGQANAFQLNAELEFSRNRER